MKKVILLLSVIAITFIFVGCKTEISLDLTGPNEISVNESVLFVASTNLDNPTFLWESSDESIFSVEDGIVLGVSFGTATLKVMVDGLDLFLEKTIHVIAIESPEVTLIKQIKPMIEGSIPSIIHHAIDFIEEYNQATITYTSNKPELITNEGNITKPIVDTDVLITYVIKYNEVSIAYTKQVTLAKKSAIAVVVKDLIALDEQTQIEASSPDGNTFVYTSSNQDIFTVNEEGIITGKKAGKAMLFVALQEDLLSFVQYEITVFDVLDVVANDVKAIIPNEINQDVSFALMHPVYPATIAYETNSKYISNEGIITPDHEDRQATIAIMITLHERSKTYYKSVVVQKIPIDIQLANMKSWFEGLETTIFHNEQGTLPMMDDVYGRPITWVASDPGMIVASKLYPSMVAKEVKVIAFYTMDNRKYQYEFSYLSKGVTEMDKFQILDRFMNNLLPSEASNRIILPLEEEVVITQSIVYPNTVSPMRPGVGLVGRKMPGGVKYIVIHDTGMSGPNDTAVGVKDYLFSQANSPTGRVASWHFTIDEKDCFQHVPDDEIAWHAGDGSAAYGTTYFNNTYQAWSIGGGNQNGIGIETCINQGGNYQLTLRRTAKLVASLLVKHNLGIDAIKQHNDFSGKNCPAVIRSSNGRWQEFLKSVEAHLLLMSLSQDYEITTTIDQKNAINQDGIISNDLILDQNVNIHFAIRLGSEQKQYDYTVIAKGMTTDEKFSSLYLHLYQTLIPRQLDSSLVLPLFNEAYSAKLSWESSNPELLANDGTYTKPEATKMISLWVTMEIDGKTLTKVFKISVS